MVRRFGSVSFLAVAAATGIASLQVTTYFNPKEFSVDKPTAYGSLMEIAGYRRDATGKALVTVRMSVGMPRIGWEVLTSYGGTAPVVLPLARLRDPATGKSMEHWRFTFDEIKYEHLDQSGGPLNVLLTLRGDVGTTTKTPALTTRPTRILPSYFRMTLDGYPGLAVTRVDGFTIKQAHVYQHNQTDLEFLTLRATVSPSSNLPANWASAPPTGPKTLALQIGGSGGQTLRFHCVGFQRLAPNTPVWTFKVLFRSLKVGG